MIIKVDGIDGAGKTTVLTEIQKCLPKDSSIITSEFGASHDTCLSLSGTKYSISELIRKIALDIHMDLDDAERQFLLTVISRRNNRVVIPTLQESYKYILVDRSGLANYAYGCALGNKYEVLYELAVHSVEKYDLIVWLDTPLDICISRLEKRQKDFVESKGINYLKVVRQNYLDLYTQAKQSGNTRLVRVDGARRISHIVAEIHSLIAKLIT